MIEILNSGAANSVQDLGRPGYLHLGISTGGAMDAPALSLGNLMLGNDAGSAGLEIVLFPFRLKFLADCRFALTGADCEASLDERRLSPAWVCNARAGQVLSLKPPRHGARCYLTFAGGIEVEPVLGSRSTDLKTGFGGLEGRAVQRGDRLALAGSPSKHAIEFGTTLTIPIAERSAVVTVRVLPGAELEAFDDASRHALYAQEWTITPDSNRMGMRLKGEPLVLSRPLEMLSHGILPGTVQVPPSGLPIIQLADANTCGGYPKIAHVIDADLCRLAQAPIGARIRFEAVTQEQSMAAQEELDQRLQTVERIVRLRSQFS